MSGRTKPRRRMRSRAIAQNPIALAVSRASKVSRATLAAVMDPVRDAFTAMREGVATELQWSVVASSVNVAMTIENQGVVTGLTEHLKSAELALEQIGKRARASGAWKPTALYYQEIDALHEYIPLHQFQLEQLSEGEVLRALDTAEAVIRSAGGTVVRVDNSKQLELIGGNP